MKREFAFDDSLRMLEVLWSSLPADPPHKELRLYDVQFHPVPVCTPPISPLVKTIRENPYTKVCALRRQSSSISLHSYSGKKPSSVKRQIHSLDENVGRSNCILDIKIKHQSLDDTVIAQKAKSLDNSPKSPKNCVRSDLSQKHPDLSPKSPLDVRPRSVSPLESKSDSVVLNNRYNSHRLATKSKSAGLSSSMTNLIKNTKKTGHFKDLKEKLATNRMFSSIERLDKTSIKEEPVVKANSKMVKNLNEFLNFAAGNKNKICDRSASMCDANEKPKITLTKSSFDDSESYSTERTQCYSSASNSCDDTFDECSPDDSQEYFPMTTSVTRELRLELENLDRQVFGNHTGKTVSPGSEYNEEAECVNEEECNSPETKLDDPERIERCVKSKSDDIFVWENPLHQTSPKKSINTCTPDNQVACDEFATIVDESSKSKTVTPIRIINAPKQSNKNDTISNPISSTDAELMPVKAPELKPEATDVSLTALTNSCEEVTENKGPTLLPPPNEFGGGNPFLMFLCITVLLQHRDHIMTKGMDYNEMAMHFDKMVRKHNVIRVLNQARQMYARYIKQHTIAQQKVDSHFKDC